MGLPISIHVRGPGIDSTSVNSTVAEVFSELRTVDRIFSTYREDSDISRIRRGELSIAHAHPDVAVVEQSCRTLLDETNGLFNAWTSQEQTEQTFDPTGWVKGWGVQRAAQRLLELPEHDAYVNAGGDMILRMNRTDTPWWRIGIENPRDPGQIVDVVDIGSGAIATSGSYARGLHIRDQLGQAANAWASVSITGASLEFADAYATAAFAAAEKAPAFVESLQGFSGLLIDLQGSHVPVRWISALAERDIRPVSTANVQPILSLMDESGACD